MNSLPNESAGVEDALLQLGSDGYTCPQSDLTVVVNLIDIP
jgi:hypothetical protein